MRRLLLRLAVVFLLGAFSHHPAAAQITVRASITPPRVQIGERAVLQIDVAGAQDVAAPGLPAVPGLDARYVGPSTQVSIVNGQMSASVQHRYALESQQVGRYTIGAIEVAYKGQTFRTEPQTLEVVAAQAGGAPGKPIRLLLTTSKTDLYVNETIAVDVTLQVGQIRVGDLQFPTLPVEGANLDKFPQPNQGQQVIDGQQYSVVHFQSKLTPVRDGTLTLGPAAMTLTTYDQRRRGSFFDDAFAEGHQSTIRSEPLVLNVLPLPKEGKPAGYGGAVGNFTLEATASPAEVNAGDPITLRMVLSGRGNLDNVAAPSLTKTQGFRVYDPKLATSNDGLRIYEQVLIPNDATVTQIPAVRFSYFDTAQRQYQTLQTDPIPLTVRAAQQPQQAQILSADAPPKIAAPEELGHDIIFIKDDPGSLRERSGNPFGGVVLWLLQFLALGGFVAARVYDQRRSLILGDARFARFTKAGKVARDGLTGAEAALRANEGSGFLDAIARTIQEYLAAKLDLPVGSVDAESVRRRGVADGIVQRVAEVADTCERLRFAPGSGTADLQALLTAAHDIVDRLERQRKWSPKGAAMLVASLLIFGAASVRAVDQSSPQTSFFQANTLYKQGEFAAAVTEYEQVVHAGLESAPLYFNLGNAYFKAGDKGRAILNYERALRLQPGDPDVQANLSYARSLSGGDECAPSLWHSIAFPLAGRVSARATASTACFLWLLVFGCLAAWHLWRAHPRWLLNLATAAAILWFIACLSAASEWWSNRPNQTAVIIAGGSTAARFEPAASGTEHYTLKQGSLVHVVERRDGWWQVARCDGRRGWVDGAALEALE